MRDFDAILGAAQQLGAQDRLRLISALWDGVPSDAELPLHEEWELELERRVAELALGQAETVPWSQVRAEALRRVGHDATD